MRACVQGSYAIIIRLLVQQVQLRPELRLQLHAQNQFSKLRVFTYTGVLRGRRWWGTHMLNYAHISLLSVDFKSAYELEFPFFQASWVFPRS